MGLKIQLPNIRRLITPDPGYTIAEIDFDRADLCVVAWDSDCEKLKERLQSEDVHQVHADLFPELSRQLAKGAVHGTNYCGKPGGIAPALGVSPKVIERFQAFYFKEYPEIREWQQRIISEVAHQGAIRNIFGYKYRWHGRRNDTYEIGKHMTAWIGQSTIAKATTLLMHRLYQLDVLETSLMVLFQVHDSVVLQYLTAAEDTLLPMIKNACQIEIPYRDPLILGTEISTSISNWGQVKPL